MLKKRKPQRRIYHYLILAVMLFLVVYITILDDSSFLQVMKAKMKNRVIKKEVETVTKQNAALADSNKQISDNPQVIEKYAREKMGMQKPGEKVFRFYKEKGDSLK